jgi:hypothetical protein
MENIMLIKAMFIFTLLGSQVIFAETITCKGKTDTQHDVELIVNMAKGKSTIRYYYGATSMEGSVLQGLDLHNKRIYKTPTTLRFQGLFDSTDSYLELTLDDGGKILSSKFNKPLSGFDKSPFECAVSGSFPEAPTCDAYSSELLISAVKNNDDLNAIEWQLSCGANVNYKDKNGCTPLLYAFDSSCGVKNASSHGPGGGVFAKTNAISDLLVQNGAFIDLVDPINKETALIKAAKFGVSDVYDNFIASEANFDAQDIFGNTALMYAVLNGDTFIVKDILNGNPDRRLKNKKGETAFDLAKHWQKDTVLDLVRVPDITVAIQGHDDGTCSPLIIDVKKGQVVEVVLNATEKMFKFESDDLGIDMMADRNSSTRQIFSAENEGLYKFTCGFHGASSTSQGVIVVK